MTPQERLKKTEHQVQKNLLKQKPILDKLLKKANDNYEKNKPKIEELVKQSLKANK